MKKILTFIGIMLLMFTVLNGQTLITTGMTGAQTRTAINNNFIGIYPITYNTTSSSTGVVLRGGVRFIHNYPGRMSSTYAGSGTDSAMIGKNLYIGLASGNFTQDKRTGCNTAVGDSTGYSLTTGLANTFVGFSAGKYNTSGQRNVFIGRQAGWRNTTAHSNTFIGESSGERNTTGGSNTMVGTNAGQYLKGGSSNTGIGFNSLFGTSLTPGNTGVYNTALGDGTGAAITDGSYNVFIGGGAGALMTTGDNNVIIGMSAGASNVTGIYNAYVGTGAFYSQTSGDNNVALGAFAGRNNISGSGNLFLGNAAGYYETGSNTLMIDYTTRANEADARIKALVYGKFGATPVSQLFTLNAVLKLTPMADPPASAEEGMIYSDTDHHLYYYNGSTWKQLDN